MLKTTSLAKALVTITDAASILNCSYGVVHKLVSTNKLLHIRRGRTYYIPVSALEDYINSLVSNVR